MHRLAQSTSKSRHGLGEGIGARSSHLGLEEASSGCGGEWGARARAAAYTASCARVFAGRRSWFFYFIRSWQWTGAVQARLAGLTICPVIRPVRLDNY
jgi:hypothetical protein